MMQTTRTRTRTTKILATALTTLLLLLTPYMLYKALVLATRSTHPLLVVISESMAPALHRGDVILVSNRVEGVRVGEIPVVWFGGQRLPMVHRVVRAFSGHGKGYGQGFLTKGDNNPLDDVGMYPPGREWVRRDEVVGVVRASVPYLGYVTLAWNEWPWFRAVILGLICLVGLLS